MGHTHTRTRKHLAATLIMANPYSLQFQGLLGSYVNVVARLVWTKHQQMVTGSDMLVVKLEELNNPASQVILKDFDRVYDFLMGVQVSYTLGPAHPPA